MLLVFATSIAAIAAGCGDDDSSGADGGSSAPGVTVTTSSLTKAQFVKKAGEICSNERQDIPEQITLYQEKNPPGDKSPEVFQAEGVQAVILPVLEAEIAKIRDLGAPAGDEDQVEEILSGQQEAIDKVASMKKIPPVEDGWERHFDSTNKLMVAYGLDACPVR